MFQNALRRVISNPDISMNEVHDESQVEPVEQEPARDRIVVMENMPDATAENSMPFTLIHSRSNSSSAMMSSSTLSEDDHHEQTQQELMDEAVADEVNDDNDENNDQPDRPRHRMRRMDSEEVSRVSSQNSSRDWGWFEDVHQQATGKSSKRRPSQREEDSMIMQRMQNIMRDMDPEAAAAAMAVTAPTYVLEESLASQRLWKTTAGQRPPQPMEERAFYERMWAQNFQKSQVSYGMPSDVLTAASPLCLSPWTDGNFSSDHECSGGNTAELESYHNLGSTGTNSKRQHSSAQEGEVAEAALVSRMNQETGVSAPGIPPRRVHGSEGDLIVLVRGDNVFGTTVSKSFVRTSMGGHDGVDTVNVSIASYRVVESAHLGKYAQFLVIYREGSIQDTVGVWKRYRDFEELANTVSHSREGCVAIVSSISPLAGMDEPETEHLPNAMMSWRLLQKRKRWYRCLDAGYLSLKVFLLERFLHDILFESTSPKLLREFVGPTAV